MKLYSIYTPSNVVLRDEWFLPTLMDDFKLDLKLLDVQGSEECMSPHWWWILSKKVDVVLDALDANVGGWFVYCDIDIQFFGELQPQLKEYLSEYVFLCQLSKPTGMLNPGFFAVKVNEQTMALWREVKRLVWSDRCHDTAALNWLLRYDARFCNMRWIHLPVEFYSGTTLTGKRWEPGDYLPVPDPIVLHHACGTYGVASKIEQLRYVRNVVEKRR